MDLTNLLAGIHVIWRNLDYLAWGRFPNEFVSGILLTLLMSIAAIILSSILGLIAGVGLTIMKGWARLILVGILGFLRAIPVIMLIFWTYFLLPILFNVDVPAISTVILALALIGGAYIGYALYAGMIAVAPDQWQAAYSLGLNKKQVIIYIILPQAIRMMMPSFVNQWVSLIKDSSLAYIVGVAEFTFLATQVNNRAMIYPMEIFLFVIVVYFVICLWLDFFVNYVTKEIFK